VELLVLTVRSAQLQFRTVESGKLSHNDSAVIGLDRLRTPTVRASHL
jgi:hypothetical protein